MKIGEQEWLEAALGQIDPAVPHAAFYAKQALGAEREPQEVIVK